ncbi:MAG: hypothetical protein AAF658_02415, partial [Myxococcota bacterium]
MSDLKITRPTVAPLDVPQRPRAADLEHPAPILTHEVPQAPPPTGRDGAAPLDGIAPEPPSNDTAAPLKGTGEGVPEFWPESASELTTEQWLKHAPLPSADFGPWLRTRPELGGGHPFGSEYFLLARIQATPPEVFAELVALYIAERPEHGGAVLDAVERIAEVTSSEPYHELKGLIATHFPGADVVDESLGLALSRAGDINVVERTLRSPRFHYFVDHVRETLPSLDAERELGTMIDYFLSAEHYDLLRGPQLGAGVDALIAAGFEETEFSN